MIRPALWVIGTIVSLSGLSLQADVIPATPGTIPVVTAGDPPIIYTDTAVGSGTLGGKAFTNAQITLMVAENTGSVVMSASRFFTNTGGTFTVNIAGVGTATFTDTMEVFDTQVFSPSAAAGFGDLTCTGCTGSVLDTFNTAFSTYNLTTAIGPLSGASFIRPDLTFGTSLGGLNITSAGNSTFTATIVPEPTSLILFGTIAGIFAYGLKRKRARP